MTLPLTPSMLEHLLQRRNAYPTGAETIDDHIWSNFTRRYAVLVLDMSGFSRLTIEYGIIHFLAMLQRLVDIVAPIIEAQHGTLFKQEADNVFAVFPTVDLAVAAAFKMLNALAIANKHMPNYQALYASMGIGYGDVIAVSEPSGRHQLFDVFGSEMNLASKLGEDLAEAGEILLTQAAYKQLTNPDNYTYQARSVTISKVNLDVYALGILSQQAQSQLVTAEVPIA
ncbi:MAG: adenylate/guanylate cyclase domain-containing protein [Leptolyngbyaceae bacterium]|nr:adenylate/guanylate cyclase domain-containing protein [Leptolyngbyaceae bacterium]